MDRCLREHQGNTTIAPRASVAWPTLRRTTVFPILAAVILTGLVGWPRSGLTVETPSTPTKTESASAAHVSFHRYASFDLSPGDASVVVWSPDGKHLAATGILNATVSVFDVQSKKRVLQVRRESASEGLAYSPDGKLLAGGNGNNRSGIAVNLWETATGKLRLSVPVPFLRDPASGGSPASHVYSIVFSPDGRYLAVGYAGEIGKKDARDENIFIYEVATGKLLKSFGRLKDSFITSQIVFHPDGIHLAEGTDKGLKGRLEGTYVGDIRVWNVKTAQLVRTIKAHTGSVTALAFNPQGNLLVSATETGKVYKWLANFDACRMDLSTCKYETTKVLDPIRIWDWKSSRMIHELEIVTPVRSLALNPDGRLLAAGTVGIRVRDTKVRIWDTTSWSLVGTQDMSEAVMSLGFSPDGERLAVGAGNKAEIWNIKRR